MFNLLIERMFVSYLLSTCLSLQKVEFTLQPYNLTTYNCN